ncbi:21910_t:CDS:1, partial [Dentiscutata erythropus]
APVRDDKDESKLDEKKHKNDKLDDKLDKSDDRNDDKSNGKNNETNNSNIKKLLLGYFREFPNGKFNGSLDDNNLIDRMINASTELTDQQKLEYQKMRVIINNLYKDEELDHYFVDPDDNEYVAVFLDMTKATFEDVEQLVEKIIKMKSKIYSKLHSFFGSKITLRIFRLVERNAMDNFRILLKAARELVKDDRKLLKKIDKKLGGNRKSLKVDKENFKKMIKHFKSQVVLSINNGVSGPFNTVDLVISYYKEVVEASDEELKQIKKLIIRQFSKQPEVGYFGGFFTFFPEGDFKYKMSLDPLNKHQFMYVIYRILVERVINERLEYKVNNIFDQLDFSI